MSSIVTQKKAIQAVPSACASDTGEQGGTCQYSSKKCHLATRVHTREKHSKAAIHGSAVVLPLGIFWLRSNMPMLSRPKKPPAKKFLPLGSLTFTHLK
jgi:hypothetical protein